MSAHSVPPSLPCPQFRRETRLGLVVYGGVALAIYMNGVCREFYDAVRGRGIYKLFKALTDSDIVVDILSGTSAGGINGVLLSYALANSTEAGVVDFAHFADIWRTRADIHHLLRQPREGAGAVDSLLDGEGYYQEQLEAVFRQQAQPTTAPPDEWRSPPGELDLFVTGTDILGRLYTVLDDTGRAIEVKDHRSIFHLKHRPGRKEPLAPRPETYTALAKLCRLTSCFPLAFPVVSVQIDDQARPADRLLTTWGQLDQRWLPESPPAGGYQLHFVDGGVLDNRPFSYAIEAIYYRTANRPVERKLFYIDPSPDRFLDNPVFAELRRPNVWQVVQESLVGMPSYESISNDLTAIAQHNETVRRYRTFLAELEAGTPVEPTPSQEGLYQLTRFLGLRDRAIPLVLGLEASRPTTPPSGQGQAALTALAALLYGPDQGSAANPQAAIAPPAELQALRGRVLDLDIEYLIRKHFYIIRKLRQQAENPAHAADSPTLQLLAERLNRQLRLLEILRAGLTALLSQPEVVAHFCTLADAALGLKPGTPAAIALREQVHQDLLRLHRFWFCPESVGALGTTEPLATWLAGFAALPQRAEALAIADYQTLTAAVTNWLPQDDLTQLLERGQQRLTGLPPGALRTLLTTALPEPPSEPLNALVQLEKSLNAILNSAALTEPLRQEISPYSARFRALDCQLYPLESLAGLREKQLIATVRISPEDAQRGFGRGLGLEEKLAGNALYAFGGFFKQSWRANDILWGRLDGLNRLADGILTREAVANFPRLVERQCQSLGLTPREYLERLLQAALPDLSLAEQADWWPILEQLAHNPAAVAADAWEAFLDRLVQAGQQQILQQELPGVMQEAIAEQLTWQQQKVAQAGEPPRYLAAEGYFNRTVSAIAAAQLASQALGLLAQAEPEAARAQLAHFFRTDYRLGREELLTDIPGTILQALGVRSLLVLRDLLNTLWDTGARGWQRRLVYRLANGTLQLAYWWLQRQSPLPPPSQPWQRGLRRCLRGLLLLGLIAGLAIAVARFFPAWLAGVILALLLARLLGLWRWLVV